LKCTLLSPRHEYADFQVPKEIALQAWNIALDGYRTLAPLKHPPHILALAYIQLACLLHSHPLNIQYSTYLATSHAVNLVLIDLLDLYIHHLTKTRVGQYYPLNQFMNLQIGIRREVSAAGGNEEEGVGDGFSAEREVPKARDPTAGDRGTVRFILDWDRVVRESEILESLA
jgi:CTD kinase subunit beta